MAPDGLASEMNRPESRFMTPGASVGIFGIGLLFQMLSCPFVFVFTQALQEQPLGQMIMFVLLLIWFFLPLVGVFGIIVGVKCYLRSIGTFLPLVGIALNALWLAVFGIICFYIFVLRISV
jgi:hypothetical protein